MYSFIVFIALLLIGYQITGSFIISLIIAILFSSTVEAIIINKQNSKSQVTEGMTGSRKDISGKRSKSKSKKKKREDKTIDKVLGKKIFPKGKYTFDPKASYKKVSRGLSRRQNIGLKRDTKNLIKTQEKLMSTLKEMGPVLSQGKTIIGAFDNFFGDGSSNKNDLAYMTKRLGIKTK